MNTQQKPKGSQPAAQPKTCAVIRLPDGRTLLCGRIVSIARVDNRAERLHKHAVGE